MFNPDNCLGGFIIQERSFEMKIYIRRRSDREVVKEIDVSKRSESFIEKCIRGILRNLNTDEYFVDDSNLTGRETILDF